MATALDIDNNNDNNNNKKKMEKLGISQSAENY